MSDTCSANPLWKFEGIKACSSTQPALVFAHHDEVVFIRWRQLLLEQVLQTTGRTRKKYGAYGHHAHLELHRLYAYYA